MTDFGKIAQQMRADWDRRIKHDYRFWMSDGHSDDLTMWQSGERDLTILSDGIANCKEKVFLEIGCGVGRLIRAAVQRFKRVIGIDVSEQAIAKARELIGQQPNLELHVGNGFDLHPIADHSVDFVLSFAALTSMPTDVICSYLREIHRVVSPTGVVRLQMYLGNEQRVTKHDTLHLRCFKREHLIAALQSAGFEIENIGELQLPFQVSFKEIGIEAVVVTLRRVECVPASVEQISALLLPGGEAESGQEIDSGEIEYWMSLNYAKDLVGRGEIDRARETLEYALSFAKTATIDVSDLLNRIVSEVEKRDDKSPTVDAMPSTAAPLVAPPVSKSAVIPLDAALLEHNLALLRERFPEVHAGLAAAAQGRNHVEIRSTLEGPAIYSHGQCLDHPQKPGGGGKAWAKRVMNDPRFGAAAQLVVFGFGGGYHVEALAQITGRRVCVIEPDPAVFLAALGSRDMSAALERIEHLAVGESGALDFIGGQSELLVRPATHALESDYCARIKSLFYSTRGFAELNPSIAVLGPIQGGTLPILTYTTRAFAQLRQRTRLIDMSGFAPSYHCLEKFVHEKMRQSSLQGHYIEMMSQVVLESLNEKPVDILVCMAQAPISGRVLSELRRRGIITVLWFVEDYLRFTYWRDIARYYDYVFTIQRGECIDAIKAAGAGEVHYLATACDPYVHTPVNLTTDERARWGSPISFVGAGYHNRQQTFATLCELPLKLWGTEWPDCRPFDRLVQEQGRRLAPEEYIKIFNATDVNINLHSSAERDGVDPFGDFLNPRTFELAACGAFQLVDQRTLLSECFEAGKELVTFETVADLRDKIDYYLKHPEERRQIAQRGRERALREHTYEHRLREMLNKIYAGRYDQLKRRQESSPWSKMLERAKPHKELHSRCEAAYKRGEEPVLDGLVADIVSGKGKLSETEQKLLFLYHVRKQIIRMRREEGKE